MPISETGLQQVIEAIKLRMRERGVTGADIGKATGHAPSTITRLLNGETKQPRFDTLEQMARFLDLDITDVMKTAYGSLTDWELAEAELVSLYRQLSEAGQEYLMRAARSFAQQQGEHEQ